MLVSRSHWVREAVKGRDKKVTENRTKGVSACPENDMRGGSAAREAQRRSGRSAAEVARR